MALTITLQTAASLAASTPAPATVTVNTGLPGPQGLPGTAATIAVGSVFAVPNGTPPTVTNVGTSSAAVFNFQLETGPQGTQGIQGIPGPAGATGPAGQGVPIGGTAGQVLAKIDGTNYNTHWVDSSSSVAWGSITGTLSNQTDLQTALNGKYSTSNPAGYITSAALSGYATQSFVTSQGYITSSALTGYATQSFVTSQGYITSSALTPYLTISSASSTYTPKAPNDGNYYIQQSGSWVQLIVS